MPAFFDPSGNMIVRVCPRVPEPLLTELQHYDRMAAFMGMLPPGLDKVLCWDEVSPNHWRRLSLSATQTRLGDVQMALAFGGLRVWLARCHAMGIWLGSAAAAGPRAAEHVLRAERGLAVNASKRRRTEKTMARAVDADMAADSVPLRRSSREMSHKLPQLTHFDRDSFYAPSEGCALVNATIAAELHRTDVDNNVARLPWL
jgi:hypothetical protein